MNIPVGSCVILITFEHLKIELFVLMNTYF